MMTRTLASWTGTAVITTLTLAACSMGAPGTNNPNLKGGGAAGGGMVGSGNGGTTMPPGQMMKAMYTVTVFDGPGDNAGGTVVNGLNDGGAIVGFSSNADDSVHTNWVRNRDGSFNMLNLGDPGAMAIGINAGKDIVGAVGDNAVMLRANGMMAVTQLGAAMPNNTAAEVALGVNNGDMIVGQYTTKDTMLSPGFLLADGKFTTINPPTAAATNAQGIDGGGLVVGFFATAAALAGPIVAGNPAQHGFTFDPVAGTYTMLPDPKQPNLFLSQYLAINDHNQTAGYWQDTAGSQHGFVYDLAAGTFTFLDAPDAAAVMGVTTTQIVGINNAGELAGFFIDAKGVQHGFYATPNH